MRMDWNDYEGEALTAEEVAVRLYDAARLKSKRRKLDFDLKFNDVLRQVAAGTCRVTGIPFDMRAKPARGCDLPFRASLDRIDNTRGYFRDNIQVVVKIYNHSKWTWNDEDVWLMAKGILGQLYDENVQLELDV